MKKLLTFLILLIAFQGFTQEVVRKLVVQGQVLSVFEGGYLKSTITGEPVGSSVVPNAVKISYADFQAGTPVEGTLYIIEDAPPATSESGATVDLSSYKFYNMTTASTATDYTTTNERTGGYAKIKISAATEPTVNGGAGIKEAGAEFVASTEMYMVIWYDGTNPKYFFLKKTP